jgi:hypothetical protein
MTLGVVAVLTAAVSMTLFQPVASARPISDCPDLHVVVVPGTLDSSASRDPHQQSGVLAPTIEEASRGVPPDELQTTYVPYPADFGYTSGGTTYVQSAARGVEATNAQIRQISAQCGPDTDIAIVGYSQGADVANRVAVQIGENKGPVPPSRIRGVYLISDPNRTAGTGLVPGAPGLRAPLNGARTVSGATEVAVGGGISSETSSSFGALTGRVVSLCTTGDFACSIPENAQIVRTGANIAEQIHIDTSDPLQIAGDLGLAVGRTALQTGAYIMTTPHWMTSSESLGEAVQKNSSANASWPTLNARSILGAISFFIELPVSWDAKVQHEREAVVRDNLGLVTLAVEPGYWYPGPSHSAYFGTAADSSGRTGSNYVSTWLRESADSDAPSQSAVPVAPAEPVVDEATVPMSDPALDKIETAVAVAETVAAVVPQVPEIVDAVTDEVNNAAKGSNVETQVRDVTTVIDDGAAQADTVLDTVDKVVNSPDPVNEALTAISAAIPK